MMTGAELMPCPKCKGTHQHFRQIFSYKTRKWWVKCICGYYSPAFDTLEEAFVWWNSEALPEESFKESGTGVNTCLAVIGK